MTNLTKAARDSLNLWALQSKLDNGTPLNRGDCDLLIAACYSYRAEQNEREEQAARGSNLNLDMPAIAAWAIARVQERLGDLRGMTSIALSQPRHRSEFVTMLHLTVTFPAALRDQFETCLTYFCCAESLADEAVVDGKRWHIGDGDDSLAVAFTDTSATIWVRHFGEQS